METTHDKSAGDVLILKGTLPKIKREDAVRLAAYLAQGDKVIAQTPIGADGQFQMPVNRSVLTDKSTFATEAIIGPAGMGQYLDPSRNLQRVELNADLLRRAKAHYEIPLKKIDLSEAVLAIWWGWCRNYCVSGTVVGPDGCPVPGAQVTVSTVLHASGGGFSVTAQDTVMADNTGHFTACFEWCSLFSCWPCRPFWWVCWPWWWEWDILHILEQLEERLPQVGPLPPGPLITQRPSLPLKQPASADLMAGQGFTDARRASLRLVPDQARTNLIQRKLSDPRIRAIFPWWWWCCENPNILFTVSQGANVILQEDPATDTRWCFPNNSTVTLVGNKNTVSACSPDPRPARGFIWTRVGNTLVTSISNGYAQGNPLDNASDLAFAGTLNIYGQFASASPVAYYQVLAGQWTGNPARGGTAPGSAGVPIGPDLYNWVFVKNGSTVTVVAVKMGPFNHGTLTNLYATEEQRPLVPVADLPAFPAGTVMGWAYPGLKVSAPASALIGGSLGAVTLAVAGFDTGFNAVGLPVNTDDHLTLEIDTTGLSAAHINSFSAFTQAGTPVSSSTGTTCPAFNVGPNGYVVLNVSASDTNGHLCYYELVPNYGHSLTGICVPDVRGYQTPLPFSPTPVPGPYQQPVIGQKSFVGGTENITFYPAMNCCYDFRLTVMKRVTDGTNVSGSYVADFWTAMITVS